MRALVLPNMAFLKCHGKSSHGGEQVPHRRSQQPVFVPSIIAVSSRREARPCTMSPVLYDLAMIKAWPSHGLSTRPESKRP